MSFWRKLFLARARWVDGAGRNRLPRDWWRSTQYDALASSNWSAPQELVGESNYQTALEELIGQRYVEGVYWDLVARVGPINDHPRDPHAVGVMIDGRPVGYIPADACLRFREELATARPERPLICKAQIVGGFRKADGTAAHYGVKLDLERPLRVRTR